MYTDKDSNLISETKTYFFFSEIKLNYTILVYTSSDIIEIID